VIRTGVGSVIAGNAGGPVSFKADHFDLERAKDATRGSPVSEPSF
jgi:hypothetical protein